MPRPKRRGSSLTPPAPAGTPKKPKHHPQQPPPAAAPGVVGGAAPGDAGGRADANLGRAFELCGKLLGELLQHEDGWVFAKPVDARALRLLDYYEVVSEPMDLGTVRRRLERGRYADPRAFAADVRLTFQNALSYNDPGDPVHESAVELSDIFESRWPSVLAALKPPPPPDAERKKRLTGQLPRLPVAKQAMVAEIMKKRNWCLREEKGRVEVDLNKADAATLDELDRLVAEHAAVLAGVANLKQEP